MSDTSKEAQAWFTIEDLKRRWKVSRSTLYLEIKRGRLKRKHIGGQVRFALEEILRYERLAD